MGPYYDTATLGRIQSATLTEGRHHLSRGAGWQRHGRGPLIPALAVLALLLIAL